MISATAKLLLQERTIVLECSIAPDNVHIAPVYQDFLDKYDGPITVDVDILQDRDAEGAVINPGHALIKLTLTDADDVEVHDSDVVEQESAPPGASSPPSTPGAALFSVGSSGSGAFPNPLLGSSSRTETTKEEAKPPQAPKSAMDLLLERLNKPVDASTIVKL